jgi:prepilin-type N-terminal cleavage/methylation domain-containing protein
MQVKKQNWFTLVELIVVITILSVLATIWFISFSWYTVWARDSVRLTDINNIEKWLSIFKVKAIKYPIPDDKVNVTSIWNILNYQWYAWGTFLWALWISGWWIDPLTQEYYTITTNVSRTRYQLLSYFENEENVKKEISWVSNTYAVESNRYIQLSWDKLGIIINSTTQEPLQKAWNNIDISQSTSIYEVHISDNETITGTDVSLWALYSKSSCKRLKEFDSTLPNWKYMIDPLADGNEFETLCDMITDWWGWTLYSGKNIHELPIKWFLEVHSEKLDINFKEIRWNYRSPLWIELPLIFELYSNLEWKILLSWWQSIDATLRDNPELHYSDTESFSRALSFWEKNTSWVNIWDFRWWIKQNNINYMASWKNSSTNEYYTNMWTSFSWNKSNVSKYLWFPSTPYHSTYKIWDETFESVSAYVNWIDGRSIAIWIK